MHNNRKPKPSLLRAGRDRRFDRFFSAATVYAPQEAKKVRGADGWLTLPPRNVQIRLIEQHLKIKKRAKRVAITLASLPEALGLIGSGIGLNLRRGEEK